MSPGKHWSDKGCHPTHTWQRDGHCFGCMMHWSWQGARDKCTLRVKRSPKTPRPLEDTDDRPPEDS